MKSILQSFMVLCGWALLALSIAGLAYLFIWAGVPICLGFAPVWVTGLVFLACITSLLPYVLKGK